MGSVNVDAGSGAMTGLPVAGRVKSPISHGCAFWGCAFCAWNMKMHNSHTAEIPNNLFFICLCPGFASLVQARDQRDSSYPVAAGPRML
jgi:hypothetical protein